jgi:hypothetical protein
MADSEERVIVATGRYLGEGFDDARLDTLFLTMPISWRGTLSQYAGRLHRRHASGQKAGRGYLRLRRCGSHKENCLNSAALCGAQVSETGSLHTAW